MKYKFSFEWLRLTCCPWPQSCHWPLVLACAPSAHEKLPQAIVALWWKSEERLTSTAHYQRCYSPTLSAPISLWKWNLRKHYPCITHSHKYWLCSSHIQFSTFARFAPRIPSITHSRTHLPLSAVLFRFGVPLGSPGENPRTTCSDFFPSGLPWNLLGRPWWHECYCT